MPDTGRCLDGTAVGIVGPCRSFHPPCVLLGWPKEGGWNDDGIYIGMLTLPASEPSSEMTMSL